MGALTRVLTFYSTSKYALIKDFKLKILICFNSPIIKHWTPLHQTPHIFYVPLSNYAIFVMLEALGGGLQIFFKF
jgi:hypothetical protein